MVSLVRSNQRFVRSVITVGRGSQYRVGAEALSGYRRREDLPPRIGSCPRYQTRFEVVTGIVARRVGRKNRQWNGEPNIGVPA